MEKVRKIISEIVEKQEINTVYFVGCGGSLSGFFPAKYFLSEETKKIKVGYMNANEFVHATPKEIGKDTVVITASQRGNTAETVKATAVANELGAATVGLTFQVPSPLSDTAQYVIQYEFGPESVVENQKVSYGFKLALGSGACWGPAHQEAICIFMEMQWINASVIHSGEFFHGPFEITDKNTAFLMMKSCGHTRPLDDRALDFIKKFNNRIFVLDASQYGINELGELAEYLEPMFYNNVIGVFNNLIADARKHPLTTRRYMWKFPY